MSYVAFIVAAPLVLLIGLQIAMNFQLKRSKGKPVPALSPELDAEVAKGGKLLLYFFSPSCGPCRAMKPDVDKVSAEDKRLRPVDVSRTPEVAMRLGVMGTPSLVLLDRGLIADVRMGVQREAALRELLA